MDKQYGQPMRDVIAADIRRAVRDYFMPVRFVARLFGEVFRMMTGRPGSHGWWHSA